MTEQTTTTQSDTLYCTFHPNRETLLRCNRCERPICNSCAVLTPTGYRCKECVRGQQKIFNTATPVDYVLALVISAVLGGVAGLIAPRVGFFVLFIAPIAGTIIAEAVRAAVRKRRSKTMFALATGAAVIAALIPTLLAGVGLYSLWAIAFVLLMGSTLYYRLSGIQIR